MTSAVILSYDRARRALRPAEDHTLRVLTIRDLIWSGRIPRQPPVPPFRRAGDALPALYRDLVAEDGPA